MAFHSYTHLIGKLFNAYPCGPPSRVTGTSSWTCVDHSVSRLPPPTLAPSSDSLSLRLGASWPLTMPEMATRRFIMQKARRHNRLLRPLVGEWFQDLFHSPRGVLFTFPSRYWSTIGLSLVFSLAGWSRLIHAGLHVTRATQDAAKLPPASRTGLSPSLALLSRSFRSQTFSLLRGPTTPRRPEPTRFGLLPGRSPLLGESLLFSLPAGTKMFQFPAFASRKSRDSAPSARWVVPFGNPRIKGHLRLPAAYRSLSRPSSPVRAKASAIRPFLLSLAPGPARADPRLTILSTLLLPGTPRPSRSTTGSDSTYSLLSLATCQRSLPRKQRGYVWKPRA